MSKKIIVGTTLSAIALGIIVPAMMTLPASAYNGQGTSNLVDQLVNKFNLDKDDVQAVFDENHTERMTQMQNNQADKLVSLVESGDLTQDQADLITEKLVELKAERDESFASMSDKTKDERKEYMESHKIELDTWATENDIDISYLMNGKGGQRLGMNNR